MAVCPECDQGKHDNCWDEALDPETDLFVKCACAERDHAPVLTVEDHAILGGILRPDWREIARGGAD